MSPDRLGNLFVGSAGLLAVGLPLVVATALLERRARSALAGIAPWSALPALLVAMWAPTGRGIDLPWLLLGGRLGLDDTSRVFLFFTALLWLLSGIYAQSYLLGDPARCRFLGFYLVSMSGNIGLILAQDLLSFYLFFAVMSFAAYGLVVHHADPEALRAARVYMVMVVAGEVLFFSALVSVAHSVGDLSLEGLSAKVAQAPTSGTIIALALAGLGIKVGAVPLHVWLPLAHPAAPTPASAVLSGAMIKAGLLGWLRLLPLGEAACPLWGTCCLLGGSTAVFYGVLVGVMQNNPKTVLAYSSVSQMGFLTVGVGIGLVLPSAWSLALPAVLIHAMHHALAKGALFLGVGVAEQGPGASRRRWLICTGLVVPALALAGMPGTSGALAKVSLKSTAAMLPSPWANWLAVLLPLGAIATTLLMGRFVLVVWSCSKPGTKRVRDGLWVPWVLSLLGVICVVWLWPWEGVAFAAGRMFALTYWWETFWPIAAGIAVMCLAWRLRLKQGRWFRAGIPPGDVVVPVGWLLKQIARGWQTVSKLVARQGPSIRHAQGPWFRSGSPFFMALEDCESRLRRWSVSGILVLLVLAAVFALLSWL